MRSDVIKSNPSGDVNDRYFFAEETMHKLFKLILITHKSEKLQLEF